MNKTNEHLKIEWDKHASIFPMYFNELLDQNQLVDVILVADGNLFMAHRLVLSAMSPNFRKMFTQMPINQQAYVFMNDVSKETLENLLKFIYCGEVNVQQKSLDHFLKIAKNLNIKGLVDYNVRCESINQEESFSNWSKPAQSNEQYQSTQINSYAKHFADEHISNSFADHNNQGNEIILKIQPTCSEMYEYDDAGTISETMMDDSVFDPNEADQPKGFNSYEFFGNEITDSEFDHSIEKQQSDKKVLNNHAPALENISKRKRRQQHIKPFGFDTVADIRGDPAKYENLFINGYKFSKHDKLRKLRQRWTCVKKVTNKCHASASTINIDGTYFLKVLIAEHSH